MNAEDLRTIQAPLKARYKEDTSSAFYTLRAEGTVDAGSLSCDVKTHDGTVKAGLHPATGGDGRLACSAEMLLEALVSCAGVTLAVVATATGTPLKGGTVTAEGDLDFRGTLGVSKEVPVGIKAIRLIFALDTDATAEQLGHADTTDGTVLRGLPDLENSTDYRGYSRLLNPGTFDVMIEKLFLPEIRELLATNEVGVLGEVLGHWFPADLGLLLGDLDDVEKVRVLQALDRSLAVQAFEHIDFDTQERLLAIIPEHETAEILEEMSADDRTALLEDLDPAHAAKLLLLLSPGQRAVAEALLNYPAESVGRLMTPEYVAVKRDWSVKHVLDYVRAHGKDSETLNVIYVVDDQHCLIGDLRIRNVLLAPLHHLVRDVMTSQFVSLKAADAKQAAVEVFRKYDRTALPVIDARGSLVGIVTIDDVLDIAEQEATKELQKFGGVEALDEPYVTTPLLLMVRKRATWLVILFVGEMLTATAMGNFEGEIAKAPVLALFIPLIISSGGNSGSQAATLIIRALALGELTFRDVGRVFGREVASGLLLGGMLGSIGFMRIAIWSQFTDIYTVHWPYVALSVAFSLVGIVLWGTLSGSMLPFLLKRLGLDPATSSAPFVATLVDVTGIVIYFSVAYFFLHGLLL